MENFSEMFFKDVLEYNYTSLTFEDDIGKIMDEEFFIFPLGNNTNHVKTIWQFLPSTDLGKSLLTL